MAKSLTPRQKLAHLHRRFGLGVSVSGMAEAEALGYEGCLNRLINFETIPTDESSPFEFFWIKDAEAQIGSWRTRAWWHFQLLTTHRPLQEKLSIFWHDHFAVSDHKVEDGAMMMEYIQDIRQKCTGKFLDLLKAMSKSPALMKFLDMDRAIKGLPNENFAREVMELFTLGIGNYTEKDIQEGARALTGWGYINTLWEMPGTADAKLKTVIRDKRPFAAHINMPDLRDTSPKTILGRTGDFDGDKMLAMLAAHPTTAKYITTKLWEFFAYPNPEPAVVARLSKVFVDSGGDIKKVLFAIGRSPEFVSEKAIRGIVKCPIDYTIPLLRQGNFGSYLSSLRKRGTPPTTMIDENIVNQCGYLASLNELMGMHLFYPPDVCGWEWGAGWLSANNMGNRFKFSDHVVWAAEGVCTRELHKYMTQKSPKTATEMASYMNVFFDGDLKPESIIVVAKALDDGDKVDWMTNFDWFRGRMHKAMKVFVAAPEFHSM